MSRLHLPSRLDTADHRLASRARPVLAVVAIALFATAVVWIFTRPHTSAAAATPTRQHTHGSTTGGSPTRPSRNLAPTTAPPGGVRLPTGAAQQDGYPVKFPHTDLGAVAMDAAVAKCEIGFDYSQVRAEIDVYANPADRAALEQHAAASVAGRRQEAGVPVQGTARPPAAYATTPIAFTVKAWGGTGNEYVVNLLSYITVTTTAGKSENHLYSGTTVVRWVDGDWKGVETTPAQNQQLISEGQPQPTVPGTAAYKKAGWIAINGTAP